MTVTVVGEVTLLEALPAAELPLLKVSADLEAKITALANFSITPPGLALDVELAAEILANLKAALALGITPPSIDVQLELTLALLADLKLQLSLLSGLLGVLAASAHVYTYTGTVGALGTELQAELSGGLPGGSGSDAGFAVVFVATAPAAVTALQSLFKTSP